MIQDPKHHIILADSQFLIVESLRKLIESDENFFLRGIATNRSELFKILGNTSQPVLVITDYNLFDYNDFDDFKIMKELNQRIVVLLLTNPLGKTEITEWVKTGIKNISYKTDDRDEILTAIGMAIKGKKHYCSDVLDILVEKNELKANFAEPSHLTSSEIEIVQLISNGMTTKEIAKHRNISFHTVMTHRKNIFKKLEINNASELFMYAVKAGLIDNIEYHI
jgi:DNA-binding NarL/FixJ family response regulator